MARPTPPPLPGELASRPATPPRGRKPRALPAPPPATDVWVVTCWACAREQYLDVPRGQALAGVRPCGWCGGRRYVERLGPASVVLAQTPRPFVGSL